MFLRLLNLFLILAFIGTGSSPVWADDQQDMPRASSDDELDVMSLSGGFAKPYQYERQAYGYDPDGIEYHENQSEDFQVIFITSAPFAAGASFLLTSLASLVTRNSFDVGGDYFWAFLGGTAVGATSIACISTLTNKYPPPPASSEYSQGPQLPPSVALKVPVLTAQF
jgi:hypothetical protein